MRTLADFTAATGITPDPGAQTDYVNLQLLTAFGLLQAATDRNLARATYTETIQRPDADVYLREWPVASITSLTGDGRDIALTRARVMHRAGFLMFDCRPATDTLVVEYVGGYAALPADLAAVIDGVVATAWNRSQTTGQYVGMTASAAEAAATGSGEVKSMNVTDVVRLEYDTSSSSSSTSSSSGATDAEGLSAVNPLAPYATTIAKYRARDAGGTGRRIHDAMLGQVDA